MADQFREVEETFKVLREKFNDRKISQREFIDTLKQLRIKDAEGRFWMIGAQTGKWYYFEGSDWVQAEPPSLILLDLMMPEMNGWQFREEQLKDDRLRDIPVVVMTASRALEEGALVAREILYKPIGLGELISAVERNAR